MHHPRAGQHHGSSRYRWKRKFFANSRKPIGRFQLLLAHALLPQGAYHHIIIYNLFRHQTPATADKIFRRGQLLSAAFYSLGHGTNDAQKTMGIIASAFFTVPAYRHLVSDESGQLSIPFWIVLMAQTAIALGTLSGGWRIAHTVGTKITKLQPLGGFAAETAGAITLFLSSSMGIPVSTTHVITGAIVGVGSVRNIRSVRWSVAGRIVRAWIFTIPAAAVVSASLYGIITLAQHI